MIPDEASIATIYTANGGSTIMRKIVPLFVASLFILFSASAALAEIKAVGGYSALADADGNGTSFLSAGARYDGERFLLGGSYAIDLDYSPAPLLQNSDNIFLAYGGPRLLDLGLFKLTAIGGYYGWGHEVTDNLLTGAKLRTQLSAAALGLQASAGIGPFGAELLYLKGVSNELEQILVHGDVASSMLELRGTVKLNDDLRAYVSYQMLNYETGSAGEELAGYGVGLTASF